MNEERLINNILTMVYSQMNHEQIESLKMALYINMAQFDITSKVQLPEIIDNSWKEVLNEYLTSKHISGKSEATLKKYKEHLYKMLAYFNKNVEDISGNDIHVYFEMYRLFSSQNGKNISNRSLDNMRLVFSSFFNWCSKKGYVRINPMGSFESIKYTSEIKEPFTDEEREMLFYHCDNIRDKAMIEYLYSTGVRVSECVNANIEDVNFRTREQKVLGKGNKERIVYLNTKSSMYLKKYLQSRNDDNPALFVSLYRPHKRLTINGVERAITRIGERANIKNCHPHRFRHTMATNALDAGMEILYVSEMLGHENINTTTIYTKVNRSKVKAAHDKYLH